MRLITRYLTKVILASTLGVLLVLAGLDLTFNLVDEIDRLKGDYGFLQLANYLLMRLPSRMYLFLPVAILVGVLMGLGSLASTSELTVIRAAGVSIPRIILAAMRPIFWLLLIALLASEFVLPQLGQQAKTYRWEKLNQQAKSSLVKEHNLWLKEGNKIYSLGIAQDNGIIYGLNIYQLDEDWRLTQLISAQQAQYQWEEAEQETEQSVNWLLSDVRQIDYSADGLNETLSAELWLDLPLLPENIALQSLATDELPLSRLMYFADYLQQLGQPSGYYWLAFWKTSLLPVTVFSVVLLGASFTFGPLRTVPAGTRVFHGVIIALAVKFAQDILGPASLLWGISPIFAVLIPASVCVGFGIFFIYKAR